MEQLAKDEGRPRIQDSKLIFEWGPQQPFDEDEYDEDYEPHQAATDEEDDVLLDPIDASKLTDLHREPRTHAPETPPEYNLVTTEGNTIPSVQPESPTPTTVETVVEDSAEGEIGASEEVGAPEELGAGTLEDTDAEVGAEDPVGTGTDGAAGDVGPATTNKESQNMRPNRATGTNWRISFADRMSEAPAGSQSYNATRITNGTQLLQIVCDSDRFSVKHVGELGKFSHVSS